MIIDTGDRKLADKLARTLALMNWDNRVIGSQVTINPPETVSFESAHQFVDRILSQLEAGSRPATIAKHMTYSAAMREEYRR